MRSTAATSSRSTTSRWREGCGCHRAFGADLFWETAELERAGTNAVPESAQSACGCQPVDLLQRQPREVRDLLVGKGVLGKHASGYLTGPLCHGLGTGARWQESELCDLAEGLAGKNSNFAIRFCRISEAELRLVGLIPVVIPVVIKVLPKKWIAKLGSLASQPPLESHSSDFVHPASRWTFCQVEDGIWRLLGVGAFPCPKTKTCRYRQKNIQSHSITSPFFADRWE